MDGFPLEEIYHKYTSKKVLFTLVILAVSAVISFGSIFVVRFTGITPDVIWDVLMTHISGQGEYPVYYYDLVIWQFYTPRAIMCIFVGAGLAAGGAVMQTLMRNPLADPYTTGVASGASFGAALCIYLGFSLIPTGNHHLDITVNAALLALVPTAAIIFISKRKTITPTTMILAGIAIMYVFRAATSIMTLSADPDSVESLYMWNVGTVGSARWDNIWIVAGAVVVSSILLYVLADKVTSMMSGDRIAKSIGIRTKLVRTVCLLIIALQTAVIVGFTGTIWFMGLVAPHVARIFVGSNLKYLIPASMACGAFILVICDCIAKAATFNGLPVGVITSIVGGPVFIILLVKGAKKVWYRGRSDEERAKALSQNRGMRALVDQPVKGGLRCG